MNAIRCQIHQVLIRHPVARGVGEAMALARSLRVAPRRQTTSGEAEGLPHRDFDADEILGGQEAERSLDDRLVHRQDL